jgi:hypothetical protein
MLVHFMFGCSYFLMQIRQNHYQGGNAHEDLQEASIF